MSYIAKIDIGNYRKGDTVPKEIAETWNKMYLESPTYFKPEIPTPVIPEKPKNNFDLNGDGVFDKKDKTLAGKTLVKKVR